MINYIEQLEKKLGTKHILVDDWNRLGWEFYTRPDGIRAVELVNYTEAKAEGGTSSFTIESVNGKPVLKVLESHGSGPHGIPWWDIAVPYEGGREIENVDKFADDLMVACHNEGQSGYWAPWRDENPKLTLLFKHIDFGSTEERDVEVPYTWNERDWKEANARLY